MSAGACRFPDPGPSRFSQAFDAMLPQPQGFRTAGGLWLKRLRREAYRFCRAG